MWPGQAMSIKVSRTLDGSPVSYPSLSALFVHAFFVHAGKPNVGRVWMGGCVCQMGKTLHEQRSDFQDVLVRFDAPCCATLMSPVTVYSTKAI
jgi:hypothetical protein